MRRDKPNYGPGSISTRAKARIEEIAKSGEVASKSKQLGVDGQPMSADAQQIKNRDDQQKALGKEVGGRR